MCVCGGGVARGGGGVRDVCVGVGVYSCVAEFTYGYRPI